MRTIALILIIVIILMGPVFAGFPNTDNEQQIIIDYTFEAPRVDIEVIEGQAYHMINMPDTEASGPVGYPRLPARGAYILLPQGMSVHEVQVTGIPQWIGTGYRVVPVAAPAPLSQIPPLPVEKTKVYTDDSPLPRTLHKEVGVYAFRGYEVLVLRLHPVQYVPTNGSLAYYSRLTVKINLEQDGHVNKLYRGLERDGVAAQRLVDNPNAVYTYSPFKDEGKTAFYKYVIITSQDLAETNGNYSLQNLVSYKEAEGISATIVTTDAIYRDPAYWDPHPLFNDKQARIRNFIRYAYTNWQTDYVLLAGDADVDTFQENIVPARRLFAACRGLPLSHEEELEGFIPADIYYAGLDGTFNTDRDERWGENATENNLTSEDEADLLAEVYIGRICVDSAVEIENFVRKTIAYDTTDFDYLHQVLMVGEYLGFEGIASWGANHMELLTKMIPDWYTVDTLYERDRNWDAIDLANLFANGTHMLHHLGHGWTNYAIKMSAQDAQYLTNELYFFIYSQTCLAGSFDNWIPGDKYYEQDSFAEAFTSEAEYGAFAAILNSRYGLGRHNSTDSPGQRYHAAFINTLSEGYLELGLANQMSKDANVWRVDENGMRWIHYEANLIGDPILAIKGPASHHDEVTVEVLRPTAGTVYIKDVETVTVAFLHRPLIIGPITVETDATGTIEQVDFYLDGMHMATDDKAPYIWKCETSLWGRHMLTAVAVSIDNTTDSHGIEAWFISS